jgi:DNA-directed RNA polymerase specialized sigma24 family protein
MFSHVSHINGELAILEWQVDHPRIGVPPAMSYPDTNPNFEERLRQLQLGENQAVETFVAEYEPYIRRAIRFRIKNAALMAAADSVDVCQSVLGGFLLKLSAGDYVLQSEDQLRALLLAIAKKKFSMLQRRESASKRARRRTWSLEDVPEIPNTASQPAEANLELAELSTSVRMCLTDDEWQLLELRKQGLSWSEIEGQLHVDAVVLKKRLSRSLRRVAIQLGLDY